MKAVQTAGAVRAKRKRTASAGTAPKVARFAAKSSDSATAAGVALMGSAVARRTNTASCDESDLHALEASSVNIESRDDGDDDDADGDGDCDDVSDDAAGAAAKPSDATATIVVPASTSSPSAVLAHTAGLKLFRAFLDGDKKAGQELDGCAFPVAAGHIVRVQLLSADPPVALLHDFATNAEIAEVLEGTETQLWTRSLVNFGEVKPVRTSNSQRSLHGTALTLWKRAHELSGIAAPPALEADGDVVRYEEGQTFGVHHDGSSRRFTYVCYLNFLSANDGGETEFPELGLRVRPLKGAALVFRNLYKGQYRTRDHRTNHVGRPVTATKYVLNAWIADSLFETD